MHQLPELMAQGTHTAFYLLMWSVSLLLQLTLFVSLFTRSVARFAPFFTNFVGFYLLRSAVFFFILNPISLASYSRLYNLFLALDVLVQFCAAAELTRHLTVTHGGWTRRNIAMTVIFLCATAVCTYITVQLAPPAQVRVDPSLIAFSYYMVFVWLWTFALHETAIGHSVAQGFAIYGIINIVANIGRTAAMSVDHPRSYAAWTYVLAGGYMVVVIFWLATLRPDPERIAPKPLGTTI
jgi:hypothetical protein